MSALASMLLLRSVPTQATISTNATSYASGSTITATVINGPPEAGLWVGLYHSGVTPTGSDEYRDFRDGHLPDDWSWCR
jgi:hypothetical protein